MILYEQKEWCVIVSHATARDYMLKKTISLPVGFAILAVIFLMLITALQTYIVMTAGYAGHAAVYGTAKGLGFKEGDVYEVVSVAKENSKTLPLLRNEKTGRLQLIEYPYGEGRFIWIPGQRYVAVEIETSDGTLPNQRRIVPQLLTLTVFNKLLQ